MMSNLFRQLAKNIMSNWSALLIRSILVFLVNPFIIHTLGDTQYGILILALSLINYLTVLDFGFAQALIRFISKNLGLGDFKKINSILQTGTIMYSISACIVMILALFLSFWILDEFNIEPELLGKGRLIIVIFGIHTAINFLMTSWGGSLGAFHRYDFANSIIIAEDILRTVTAFVLLYHGYGLISYALIFPVFALLRNLAGLIILKVLHPEIEFRFGRASRETYHMLFKYGRIGFFVSIAWLLIANMDHLLIGYFIDTSSVTQYAIAGSIIIFVRRFVHAVSFPVRPVISHFEAVGDINNIRTIYLRGSAYLYFIAFALAGGIFLYADIFINLWMGPGYQQAAEIIQILIIPASVFFSQAIGISVLYGIERHKNVLYMFLAEGVANFAISIILVNNYGVYGIAIGTIIPQLPIYFIILPLVIRKALKIDLPKLYITIVRSIIVGFGSVSGLSYLAIKIAAPSNWAEFAVEVIIIAVLALFFGLLIMGKDDWLFFREKMRAER